MTAKKTFGAWFPTLVVGTLLLAALWLSISLRETEPQPAIASSSKATEVVSRFSSLQEQIRTREPGDFPKLMWTILRLEDVTGRSRLVVEVLRRWLIEDPEAFIAFLDEAEVDGRDIWVAIGLGMRDALLSMDQEVSDQKELSKVIERVLLRTAESDPEKAMLWAQELLTGDSLERALSGIAPELAYRDPEAAIGLVDGLEDFSLQLQAAADVGVALGRAGYEPALTWAESFYYDTERAFAVSGVLEGMASVELSRAATEYVRIVEEMKKSYREQVLSDRDMADQTIDEEYEGLSPEEIERAELAKPNPNLRYFEDATRAIAFELTEIDPRKALEWAHSMDLYQGKAVALETAYEVWGSIEPKEAFESLLQESDRRPEMANRLFESWAMMDSETASAAAMTLSPGFERDSAIEGVAQGWFDAGGAPTLIAQWANGLSLASEADRVRAIVASEVAFDDPDLALKQVEQIRNPLKRSELFQEVFPNLVEESPQEARRILSTIQLSPVEIEYFQHLLGL